MQDKIIRNFSRAAHTYNDYAVVQKQVASDMVKYFPDMPQNTDISVLEIGCGTGFLTKYIKHIYPNACITVCDISKDMLKTCQDNIGTDNITYIHADAQSYDFGMNMDKKYDLIISSMTFQWFDDLPDILLRYKKLLTPTGQILFSTLTKDTFFQWYDSLRCADIDMVSPFEQDIALLLQPVLPVVLEHKTYTHIFNSAADFFKMLKYVGASASGRKYPLSVTDLRRAGKILTQKYHNHISYYVVIVRIHRT